MLNIFDVSILCKPFSFRIIKKQEQVQVVPSQMIILSTKINFWSFSFKRLTYNFVWIDFEKSKWHKCIKPQMRPIAIPNFEKIHMILNSIHANTAIVISIYKLIWNESRVVFAVWTRQREIKLRYNSLSFSSWWLL